MHERSVRACEGGVEGQSCEIARRGGGECMRESGRERERGKGSVSGIFYTEDSVIITTFV